MVTMLESKLNSLPEEITSKYPPLVFCSLNDVNPIIQSSIVVVSDRVEPIPVTPPQNSNSTEVIKAEIKTEENGLTLEYVGCAAMERGERGSECGCVGYRCRS